MNHWLEVILRSYGSSSCLKVGYSGILYMSYFLGHISVFKNVMMIYVGS